ncbi:MAG: helix-turn-helix transcriptional regulator [Bacteroidota bacterium]|nr:helix-turn-helix transcriptional regulator [Bacteroidota bacterium]MDP4251257.1 helix-turn-helix transcriptional regulator [Bacteroidota bacterium]
MTKKPLKSYSLEEMEDKYIGKRGTPDRDEYEYKLSKDVLGLMIKKARLDRKSTQEQLGKRVGVQKAQISKLESGSNGVTLNSILKIFRALKAEIHFHVTIEGRRLQLA